MAFEISDNFKPKYIAAKLVWLNKCQWSKHELRWLLLENERKSKAEGKAFRILKHVNLTQFENTGKIWT